MTTTAAHADSPLHAHWDCTSGASCVAMLSASFDAWASLKKEEEEASSDDALPLLNSMLKEALPSEHFDAFTISRDESSTSAGCLTLLWDDESQCAVESSRITTIIEQCKISAEVREKMIKIPWGHQLISKEEGVHILFICSLGVLLLFADLKVESTSCSALPAQDISTETLRKLIGMHTDAGRKGYLTTAAAVLLQVLTKGSAEVVRTLSLRGIGACKVVSSKNNENTDHAPEIQLLLGSRIIQQEHSQDSTHQNEDIEPWKTDMLVHMEANLDDITAEALAFAVEILLQNGAIDAWTAPIVMKKGRSAHTLHCLCHDDEEAKWRGLLKLIFQHTTTLGVRFHKDLKRVALRRSFVTAQTPYTNNSLSGRVQVKLGHLGDDYKAVSVKAEFDDCKIISLATGVPLQQIAASAVQDAYAQLENAAGKTLQSTGK